MACLDLKNKPLEALETGRHRGLFKHFFMSFICLASEEAVKDINELTQLSTWSTDVDKRTSYLIISGTVEEIHDAVIAGCQKQVSWEFRSITNNIYNIMLSAGFRCAFPQNKIEHKDGTFTLDATN